jgi:spoIIIJ-associated protein
MTAKSEEKTLKKQTIVTAKTVEEAIAKAVAELGAPSAEAVEYTVLEEAKKGFFGLGATPAKVEVTYAPKGAEVALDFIRNLVDSMGLEAKVTLTEVEGENKLIRVDGESAGVLIGHHGDTLDSLQYLANLAANKKVAGEKREYCRITVDVENYRLKREETLRALARRMADKVLRYKKSVMLEPMNPYERRIIHSEVQKVEGVSTNSIGSENNRKVVLYLDNEDAVESNYVARNNEENGEF